MARFFYMIVLLFLGCTPETRSGDPKPPKKGDPSARLENEQSPSEGSDLAPEAEARRQTALAELRAGRFDAGRDALRALSDEVGPSYTLLNDLAVAEALRGDFRASLTSVNEALRLNPDGLEAATNKVQTLLELGDRTRA